MTHSAEKDAPCRWCGSTDSACRDSRSGGYIKCCPDCDHRAQVVLGQIGEHVEPQACRECGKSARACGRSGNFCCAACSRSRFATHDPDPATTPIPPAEGDKKDAAQAGEQAAKTRSTMPSGVSTRTLAATTPIPPGGGHA